MRTRTLRLNGHVTSLADFTLEYPLGQVESITSGRWELAISAMSFIFSKQLAWNSIFEVSTNYIDSSFITGEAGRIREPMPLCFIRIKGQPKDKVVIGYKWRDFYEITTPMQTLKLIFKEIRDPDVPIEPIPQQERCVYVSVLLLLRRIQ